MSVRKEEDGLGEVFVPRDAYYGASTQRAVENFPVSGLTFSRPFIMALGLVKRHAAAVNRELGLLEDRIADAVEEAAQEVVDGLLDNQFVVDVFQTGSGTSTNMNANEVIAGRANEMLTGKRGGKFPVHPNDHVNLGQSSNDVIPTVLHVAAHLQVEENLVPALRGLHGVLVEKSEEFARVLKIGRTHLQDAVPLFLGQELSGHARQVQLGRERIQEASRGLLELALGGTAVGTGLNAHPEFAQRVIASLARETGCAFREAMNHFEAQGAQDSVVFLSGALKAAALGLHKVANDLRWLASGPRCGLGEINLPSLQPGSSIMPGKVNPVIPEVVIQVAAQVVGNDAAITMGGQGGTLELNTMLPLMAHNLLQSITLLASASRLFHTRCIEGMTANEERCRAAVERSLALATYLAPLLGYDRAADISRKAWAEGKTIREVALEEKILTEEELDTIYERIYGEK